MSWPLGSLLVVVLLLALGFAWYERSKPPARVLSLIATLAALATIGRIAFAALPNVKPTTDIAVFAGYALGPVPGFAVGALAALVSNFFFGQGPWTPWQMIAWGLTGAFGGVLGVATGRRLGRIGLTVACGVAGAVFGAIMDLFQLTQTGRPSVAGYLAISGTSLPYNALHVAGNVAFCLALGPSFVRMLSRYRQRFEVRWRVPAAAAGLVAAVAFAGLAEPPPTAAAGLSGAVTYLEGAQNPDGGFGPAPGQPSSALETGWVVLGLRGAGADPLAVRRGGQSAIDYLRTHAGELTDTGSIERTVLGLQAAGTTARSFAGRDLVAELGARRSPDGSFGASVNLTAFGALALAAAGAPGASTAAGWLESKQNSDGGFGFAPGTSSDVDDTGAVLEALTAAGRRGDAAEQRATAYLRTAQNADGGYGQFAGDPSNAQSSAWAAQGLIAAGQNPDSYTRGGRGPLAFIASLTQSDGSIRYSQASRQTPVWVTAQSLDALARVAFPIGFTPPAAAAPAAPAATGASSSGSASTRAKAKRRARKARRARKRHRRATSAPMSVPLSGERVTSQNTATLAAHTRRPSGGGLGTWAIAGIVCAALAAAAAGWWGGRRWLRRRHTVSG